MVWVSVGVMDKSQRNFERLVRVAQQNDVESMSLIAADDPELIEYCNPDHLPLPQLAKVIQTNYCAMGGVVEELQELLKRDSSLVAQRWMKANWLPLYLAAKYGRIEAVRILLKYGADVNAGLDDGRTALSVADYEDYPEVVELLKASGAKE